MENTGSAWVRFWNKGTWWKALLFIAAYWGIYQLLGLAISSIAGDLVDRENILGTPLSVFFGMALPILFAGSLLIVFARSVGWFGALFERQPVRGRGWMWVAVILILIPIVIRLAATQWSAWSVALVLSILFLGLCIGFTEELATRGIVVQMLRQGGSHERVVFVLSSFYFALLHAGNLISGQAPIVVAVTVVYAFGFGAMMYLSLRVTGRLIWAMLLHAATDPTTILATGGIDAHSSTMGGSAGLLGIAGLFSLVYVFLALIAIFLIKDRLPGSRRQPMAETTA